eukprot:gene9982-13432_t
MLTKLIQFLPAVAYFCNIITTFGILVRFKHDIVSSQNIKFLSSFSNQRSYPQRFNSPTRRFLYPISEVDNKENFKNHDHHMTSSHPNNTLLNQNIYQLHLLESTDLYSAAELAFRSFIDQDSLIISLKSHQMGIVRKIGDIFSKIDDFDSFFSNYIGFWNRAGSRLKNPSIQPSIDSVIIGMTYFNDTSKLIGLVELCWQEPNGLLGDPFHLPFQFNIPKSAEPYLCNLCVSPDYRRLGIGKYLCLQCESLIKRQWNRDILYLHVEKSNKGAIEFYRNLGYREIDVLSKADRKKHNMNDIIYFCKNL